MQLRPATPADAEFLEHMLLEAFGWSGEQEHGSSIEELLGEPAVAHYVDGWMLPGDFGVVALVDGELAGAAWARLFDEADPGYGFVAVDVPELSIAVARGRRGRGVGRALMEALIVRAREQGFPALSLSVEDGNPARHLYDSLGFRFAGRNGGSDTLLLPLAPRPGRG